MLTIAMVTGTSITNGAMRIGGMTTIRAGSTIIIRNGCRHTRIGVHTTAIGMNIMSGATADGGTKIIRNGFANIIMTGTDGVTNES